MMSFDKNCFLYKNRVFLLCIFAKSCCCYQNNQVEITNLALKMFTNVTNVFTAIVILSIASKFRNCLHYEHAQYFYISHSTHRFRGVTRGRGVVWTPAL